MIQLTEAEIKGYLLQPDSEDGERLIVWAKIIRNAQLKKVVKWGEGECFSHPYTSKLKVEEYNRKRHRCPECWQSLLEEVNGT